MQTIELDPRKGAETGPPADLFAAAFERAAARSGSEPEWLGRVRQEALRRFQEIGFPTLRDEDWRYTNVAPIAKLPFTPAALRSPHGAVLPELLVKADGGPLAVFLNGRYSPEHSVVPEKDGLQFMTLAQALREAPALMEAHLTRNVRGTRHGMAALNTAFFDDCAVIRVKAGVVLSDPFHVVFLNMAGDQETPFIFPRLLVVAEKGAQLTVLESHLTAGGSPGTVSLPAAEFVVEPDAVVEHCKFQDEDLASHHVATLHARMERASRFSSHSIALGAALSRNHIHVQLEGEGVECVLNGLYLTKGAQIADHFMIVEHIKPHCASHEYFNGILDDESKGVFHGRIWVHPEAQKTDAKQTNKNLLLTDAATVNTKPQLEIYADDVKCTHGATVGQLNEESVFYLRTRGIGLEKARRMLIHAFGGEIIERIQCERIREALDRKVWDSLEERPQVADMP